MSVLAEETDFYLEAFERSRQDLGIGSPAWLRTLREEAIAAFRESGFPTSRNEEWRHTSVAPIARTAFGRAESGALGPPQLARLAALSFAGALRGPRAVFVNGLLDPAQSTLPSIPGLSLRSLREALASEPESLAGVLGAQAPAARGAFIALNAAFFEDGALVEIAPGAVLREPLHLIYLSTPRWSHAPTLSHPRTLVLAGRGSEATLIESYGGLAGEAYLTNAVTEVRLEDGARLDHCKLQRESDRAYHVSTLAIRQGRDTRFADHSISLGGPWCASRSTRCSTARVASAC